MRRFIAPAVVLFVLLCASSAWALQEGEFSLAPQGGMATLPGTLGGLVGADFAYGAGVGYGICDLVGIEADFLYSVHQELDEEETGRLNLVHFLAGLGPRLNWVTPYGIPYLGVSFAAGFLRYQARWNAAGGVMRDEEDAHSFGGLLNFGYDVYIADGLTIGLAGRAGYLFSNLEYKHKDTDDGDAGGYAYVAGLARFTLLF